MTTKHTPAPWELYRSFIKKGNLYIATVWEEVNLNLIATAPDMLEALTKLLEQVDLACGQSIPDGAFKYGRDLAKAAIEKATSN